MVRDTLDFSFDARVAVQYDALRGHPPEVSAEVGRAIAREAGPEATVLEPGVGTGRIALPVVAAGGHVVGVDIAPMMLQRLLQQREAGRGRLDLVRCDVAQLPFRADVFDAVVCVHVLHLIEDWRALLERLLAILRPGGRIILGRDWVDPESFAGHVRNLFRMAVVELGDGIAAPPGARAFVEALIEHGAEAEDEGRERTAVEWRTELTPRQVLDGIRSKDDAESWVLPDRLLARVMERLDAEAAKLWPELDAPQPVRRRFVYSVLRAPSP